MSTYVFSGELSPKHGVSPDFSLSTPPMLIKAGDAALCFEVTVSISRSQVSAKVKNLDGNADLLTLRNYVRDAVMSAVDMLNYLWGQGNDVEITSVVKPNGERIDFNAGIQELHEAQFERPLTLEQLWQVVLKSQNLRRALENLREAIRSSGNTGFFCYRAVESIRQHFWKEEDGKESKKSWERLRKTLCIDKNWIDALKLFADEQRHGRVPYMSEEDRVSAMQHAWKVVDRFCVYLHRGSSQLPEGEFDQLKES